ERRFIEARRVAANLIVAKGKSAEGFIDGARDLFVAGLLYCIEKGNPTIGAVYDLLATPGEKYKLFAHLASQSEVPEVKRIFNNMAGNDTKIITSYTSVLGDGGLNLWADQLIKTATSKSDFSVYDLRRDPTSIFLCVSPNDLEVIAPLIRLIFQQLVSILQRTMPAKDEVHNVLFLLDEFKHLGKLEAIATAITTIAGYRGRFMFIIQSLSALTGAYEQHGKENFLSNTGIQVFMATADDETPQYISKAIGDQTHRQVNRSRTMGQVLQDNVQSSSAGAPLIRPEQIRLLDEDTQIVLIKGQPPLKMPKVKYYADRILRKLYNAQKGPLPDAPIQVFDPGVDVSPLAEKAASDAAPPIEQLAPPTAEAEPQPVTMQVSIPTGLNGSDTVANGATNSAGEAQNGQVIKVASPQEEAREAAASKVRDAEAEMEQQKALLERIIALQEKATGKSSSMR
ncbi:MAG: type IV secretory system conjugative DNA transfer family protein, partial [Pseudomonadota bacterium]